MRTVLSVLFSLFFLAIVGLAVGAHFKVLPPEVVQTIPFVSQDANMQSNNNPSQSVQKTVAEQLPTNNGNNAQLNISQNATAYPTMDSTAVGSSSPNNKNKANANISKVSRIYAGMKPEEAVGILNNLDDITVFTMLQKMDEEQVAKILALMNAQRAAVLSKMLLGDQSGITLSNN